MQPIIQIKDFKGGMTLNDKLGRQDQFHTGYHLDFYSRKGFLTVRPSFTRMTLSASADIGQPLQGILYTQEDGNIYFGADNGTIYNQTGAGTIASANASAQTGAIRGLVEYKGYMYYPQNTTIGRSDLAGTPAYTDNWQTGLTNVNFHPMHVSADNKLYVGDDRYVASWDGTTFTAQALDIQDDWEIQCLSDFSVNYLAIGANKKATASAQSQGCKVILWSRANSTVWDDEITIPEKSIYGMIEKNGYLWVWAGSNALSIYVIPIGGRSATKVFTFENDNIQDYIIYTYPNAIGYKEGRIYFGVSCNTSASDNTVPGVYSINAVPSDLQLNLELKKGSSANITGLLDIKSIGVISGLSQVSTGILYASFDNGSTENLIRENLYSTDTQFSNDYSSFGVYESFWFEAPAGKQIYMDGIGLDCLKRIASSGSVMVSYKFDGGDWEDVSASNYQENDGVGFYKQISRQGYRLKLKIGLNNSDADTRMYISRLYVKGKLIDDPRTAY